MDWNERGWPVIGLKRSVYVYNVSYSLIISIAEIKNFAGLPFSIISKDGLINIY